MGRLEAEQLGQLLAVLRVLSTAIKSVHVDLTIKLWRARGGGAEMLRLIKSVYVACHSRIQSLRYHHCIFRPAGGVSRFAVEG